MAKSYSQLMKQIDTLQRAAQTVRRKEIEGVVTRIKEAIRAYSLTAADLGLATRRAAPGAKAAPARKRRGKRAAARPVKFRDGAGNTWGGRGPRPAWLRSALAEGRQLSEFAV